VLVILLLAGLANKAGRVHATIMPELQNNKLATLALQVGECRVRLCVIVTDVLTTIEAAGEGVPRLGGQS
jgi:hypothetical protein